MFSCCLPTSQGPGRGQPQAADILQSYRHWVSPRPQQLWQFSQREAKNDSDFATSQDDTSGVGAMVAGRLEGEPSPKAADSASLEPDPAEAAAAEMGPGSMLESEEPAAQAPVLSLLAASSVGTLDTAVVEKLVTQLLPAQQTGDPFIVPSFLCNYRRFTTTQQVLNLLFHRYAYFQPHCEEDDRTKDALCSLLGTWLDRYPEHFCQPQDLTCLHQLLAYVQLHMPFSDLALRAQRLLTQLEDPEPKEAEAEPKDLAPTTAAAPQPESAEPSPPRAVHLSAAEALEAPDGPSAAPHQEQDVGTVPSLSAASRVGTLDTGMVEKLVNQLVPAQQRGDPFFIPTFLNIYQRFATTQQVLHLLFQRYASFQPHCEEDDRTKHALCSLLGTWLDRYPEHFCQPQDLTCLHQLLAYVQLHMPFSDLALRAQRNLTQLEDPEPKEAEAEPKDLVPTTAAAPQPESAEPSLPRAVHLSAAEALEAPEGPSAGPHQEQDVGTVPSLSAASRVGTLDTGMVEKLVNQLVPAQQRGDPFFIPTFLNIYQRFATTQQVLHLLFQRYASFQPHCEEDDRTKHALCSLLGSWLDRYPEHFCQPQDLTCLHQLVANVQLHMHFSDLALRAQRLLTQLEDLEPKEAEAEPKDLVPTTAAAPQPESAEPSPPRAVHLSAAEALEAPDGPSAGPHQEQDVGTVPSLSAASRVGTLDTGMVEKLVNQLVPAQQRGDPFFIPTFLNIYQRFATTQQVLHLLFQRYASFQPHCEEDDRTKDALCSFLGTWRDRYPEHFCQPQDLASLNQLLAYVQLQMPSSDLARRAQLLLMQLEDTEPQEAEAEAEPEAPAPGGDLEAPLPAAAALLGSDLVATPASAPQPEPPEACLSLATVPAVEALEPPASPEAKPEPEHPQPWFTKRRWPWGRRRGQRTISNQDRPHRHSPSWVRTLLSCFPIHSSGPRSGPSHE
uniref:N-terminal Ras-GEF domain-containing protein n=1 Tax=Oryctolagus cuniculus TaxID=9986 RepID=A0A5F9CWE7_RABIT